MPPWFGIKKGSQVTSFGSMMLEQQMSVENMIRRD